MMKKFLSIGVPILVVLVIGFFAVRWYRQRTANRLAVPEVSAGTEIEELSNSELESLQKLQQGVGKFQVAAMTSETADGMGEIRYETKEEKVLFTVVANLDTSNGQAYRMWLKEVAGDDFVASKTLTENKGGLQASTMVAIEKLPILVEIREGENTVLSGEIAIN